MCVTEVGNTTCPVMTPAVSTADNMNMVTYYVNKELKSLGDLI